MEQKASGNDDDEAPMSDSISPARSEDHKVLCVDDEVDKTETSDKA